MSTNLDLFCLGAAKASGSLSSEAIEQVLSDRSAGGQLLDLGAGKGTLPKRLSASGRFETVTAADIIDRPDDLPAGISWIKADLNDPLPVPAVSFETIVCCEVIEHMENPRALLREICRLLVPGGVCVISTPNCENLRSFISLLVRGHHWAFGPNSYPAHLTALTRLDLERCFVEAGFSQLSRSYTGHGGVPGKPYVTWQQISFGMLQGLRFSDNVVIAGCKMKGANGNVTPPRPLT
jgi:SAM-dependent methyltransferase